MAPDTHPAHATASRRPGCASARDRGSGPPGQGDFARGYGAELREWSLARELAALRLLAPTINMIVNAGRDPSYAAEARARMRYWLGDPAAPMWTPL